MGMSGKKSGFLNSFQYNLFQFFLSVAFVIALCEFFWEQVGPTIIKFMKFLGLVP